jgi:AcrR family transcriptional regulator
MPDRSRKSNRRQDILKAAEKLMLTKGLSGVTTRLIAEEVGCSEGALYVYFKGRVELLLAMLEECLPDMLGHLETLEQAVGRRTPQANLELALGGIFKFQRRILPLFAGLFAEPRLLEAYRKSLGSQRRGPQLAIERIARYIASEQERGRVDSSLDAPTAASLLVSACFFRAYAEKFLGAPLQPAWTTFSKALVASVVPQRHDRVQP